jgi:beta-mannanase
VGVVTLPLARNSWQSWRPADLGTVNGFEQAIRRHASVVMWYSDWAHPAPLQQQLRAVAARGSIPEITWEPWNATTPVRDQPRYRLDRITAGAYDPYIRSWARTIATYRKPVRLRLAQEMNGRWYPWSEAANGNRPGEFVRAWRHVHDIFASQGATNVQWVWSPAAITMHASQYPGAAYVDRVSLSIFNGGTELRYRTWKPFAAALGRSLENLHRIAPGKPVEISEVGCAEKGGDKAAWIRQMFATLSRHPEITSVIWFDLAKGSDWRITSSPGAAAAYAAAVDAPRYR